MQAFPHTTGAFGHVGLRAAEAMHFEVVICAIAKELRATRSKVRKPGDVLLWG
jgi:hypothetical protein